MLDLSVFLEYILGIGGGVGDNFIQGVSHLDTIQHSGFGSGCDIIKDIIGDSFHNFIRYWPAEIVQQRV